jgi:peroxiredoxin
MDYDITQLGSALEFDTSNGAHNSCVKIDDTHIMNFWAGSGNDGFTQIFEINTSTGSITKLGSALEFDTAEDRFNSCVKIDDTHVMNFWAGSGGRTQIFEINTSTGDITPLGSSLRFDTSNGARNSCVKIDDTHVMNFWARSDYDGYTQVFEINIPSTSTFTPYVMLI